jgi:uncharacterized membrane protein
MSAPDHDFAFRRKLAHEIESWLKEGLITPEQQGKILARYRVLKEAEEKAGSGKLVTTITVLGSVLVGLGVILFIAANWSDIPRWGKLSIVFVSMLGSYGLGFSLRYEGGIYPKAGASLILLGSLIFGAGIFLIAQIYHINVHYPNGPLLWGLGVLPLAYLLGFRTILSLAIADFLIWLGMESSVRIGADASGAAGPVVFISLFLMAGLALWATGLMHRGFSTLRKLSATYIIVGMFVTFSAGYFLTFDVFRGKFGSDGLTVFYLGVVSLFLISIIFYAVSGEKESGWLQETVSLTVLMAAAVGFALFYEGVPREAKYQEAINLLTFAWNLIFAAGIIGIIILGYVRRCTAYVNTGLLFFVLDVIARYFDAFWKLLPRSLFFILGGLILLSGGVFIEKKRRKILASFNMEEVGR